MYTPEYGRYLKRDTNFLEVKRQLFHLVAISLWLIPIYVLPEGIVILLFTLAITVNLFVVFKKQPFYGLFRPLLEGLERTENIDKPGIQALYANLGVFVAFVLFGDSSAVGVLTLAVGDSFSTLVGKFFGRSKLPWNGEKSWEGSLAFFLSVYPLLSAFTGSDSAVLVALLCSLGESLKLQIDDNFTLPLLATAVFHLM